jgi:hypothetical protein
MATAKAQSAAAVACSALLGGFIEFLLPLVDNKQTADDYENEKYKESHKLIIAVNVLASIVNRSCNRRHFASAREAETEL